MRFGRRMLLCFCAGVVSSSGGTFPFPGITGNFSGDLALFGPSSPALHCTFTDLESNPETHRFRVLAEGPNAHIEAEAEAKTGTDEVGAWRIQKLEIAADPWFRILTQRFLTDVSSLEVSGKLTAVGEGAWANGLPHGKATLNLSAQTIAKPGEKGWRLSGVAGQLAFSQLPQLTSEPDQRWVIAEMSFGQQTLSNAVVEFTMDSAKRFHVRNARVEILGGVASCESVELDFERGEVEAQVRLEGVELAKLQPLLSNAIAEAQGRMDGTVAVRWTAAGGLEIGNGSLRMRQSVPASIRLAPAPGLLSSHVPAEVPLLPQWRWLGALARWARVKVAAHDTIKAVELGQEPLIVESIETTLRPYETKGPTARVAVVAHPRNTDAVEKVRLNLNVSGPLLDVVKLGMSDRIAIGR